MFIRSVLQLAALAFLLSLGFKAAAQTSVNSTDSTLTWSGTGGTGFVASCTNPEIKSESTGTEDTLVLTAKCDSTDTAATTSLRLDSNLKNSSGSLAVK